MDSTKAAAILSALWELRHVVEEPEPEPRDILEAPTADVAQKRAADMILSLQTRVGNLALICRAMWSLIQEKAGATEEELLQRITDIDASDGRIDGRVTKPPMTCPECGSMVCRQFNRCLFCGFKPERERKGRVENLEKDSDGHRCQIVYIQTR